jgi:HSP20 family protein
MTGKKKTTSKGSAAKDSEDAESGIELGFGGLFRGLSDIVDLVGKLAEAGEKHIERQGEFRVKGLGDQARGVYGFSIRSGIGGSKPRVQPFGNVRASEDGLVVDEVREPLVDVFDENHEIVITAELPGVAESDISIRFEGDAMTIETLGERHYVKEVDLPSAVDPKSLKQSYNNGVLEVRVDKQK